MDERGASESMLLRGGEATPYMASSGVSRLAAEKFVVLVWAEDATDDWE